MGAKLNWRGRQVLGEIAQRAAEALTEIDLLIETEAKAELYPGHGVRSGTLRRGIQGAPGRVDGKRVRGKVSVKGVPYARRIHKRYEYMWRGLDRVKPKVRSIVGRHVRGG